MLLRGILVDRIRLRRLFLGEAPDAVVIYDDRRVRPDMVLRSIAAKHNVPVIIVPFAVSSVEADVHARRNNVACQVGTMPWCGLKKWIARRWPAQVMRNGSQGSILFFEGLETLLLAALGCLPARPWVLGGSDPEIVCALGADHRHYLIAGGVPVNRIAVTGQPSLDTVAMGVDEIAVLKDRLCRQYQLAGDRPLIVCAVPQYGEHGMAPWKRHWEATEELFAALSASGADVLLSLHPKSKQSNYEQYATRNRLRILVEPLSSALPAASLLVATFSSTVRWAIGLGIPAFVIDVVATNYELYSDLAGVVILDSHEELARRLGRFVRDSEMRTQLTCAAQVSADRVGRLDGTASQRVANAIASAVAARKLSTERQDSSAHSGSLVL